MLFNKLPVSRTVHLIFLCSKERQSSGERHGSLEPRLLVTGSNAQHDKSDSDQYPADKQQQRHHCLNTANAVVVAVDVLVVVGRQQRLEYDEWRA